MAVRSGIEEDSQLDIAPTELIPFFGVGSDKDLAPTEPLFNRLGGSSYAFSEDLFSGFVCVDLNVIPGGNLRVREHLELDEPV